MVLTNRRKIWLDSKITQILYHNHCFSNIVAGCFQYLNNSVILCSDMQSTAQLVSEYQGKAVKTNAANSGISHAICSLSAKYV